MALTTTHDSFRKKETLGWHIILHYVSTAKKLEDPNKE